MKKLLAPITLLFLVACQPSELERCIEANIKEPIDFTARDFRKKFISFNFREGENPYDKWINSLDSNELMLNQCNMDRSEEFGLNIENAKNYNWSKENQFCYTKIKSEKRNRALKICNAQGIY